MIWAAKLLVIAAICMTGCRSWQTPVSPVVGTWQTNVLTNEYGAMRLVLTFTPDGTVTQATFRVTPTGEDPVGAESWAYRVQDGTIQGGRKQEDGTIVFDQTPIKFRMEGEHLLLEGDTLFPKLKRMK